MSTPARGEGDGPARWKYFRIREVKHARAWAAAGGIAVHENLFKSRGRRTAHLLAPDEETLIAAALELGCERWWIQRTRTVHYDLVEVHLERALLLCRVAGGRTAGPPET